jgi:16S rRNA G1207 methylase RsmC
MRVIGVTKKSLIRRLFVVAGLTRIAPNIFNSGLDDSMDIILEMLESNVNAKLLDLGCGDGSNTLRFAAKIGTKEVYGIEVVEEFIKRQKVKA